jgi:two-component system, cell cycle sensor histidine kinase and response regulator CckA
MIFPGDILVVEDSSLQAKRLKRLLEQHGYRVIVARNGQEGLEALQTTRPALVVADIIMPVMDGYEMCRSIKQKIETKDIPVILLTSLTNPEDVFLGLESGADSYICKPYDGKVLLTRIESLLDTMRARERNDSENGVGVVLGGKRYLINSTRQQILSLLLSTYQDAVDQNRNLREMRTRLVTVNERLEKLVAERTTALRKEIVERKRIQAALINEKARLSVTLRSIADGIITTNTEGTVIFMNRAAEELTAWPQQEAVGKSLTTVFNLIKAKTHQGGETFVENVLKSGGIFSLDEPMTLLSRDGKERIVAVSGTPIFHQTTRIIGVVLVFRDITEHKRLEDELIRAQKLESLGVLAGGIAHDFNNLLTAILGNISLAKMYCSSEERALIRLDEAEKASVRAKDLTQQLLTFSKGGAPVKTITSLAYILKDSAWLAVRGSNVRCELSIDDDLWLVEVDQGQISQVIHNLVVNAYQAMPDGGIIKVSATNFCAASEVDLADPLPAGRFVSLSVADQGRGIFPEHLPKIYDPYFSTKRKGSGLGLATCYSILRNHGGYISVESEVGVGTTFHVYLPAALGREKEKREPKGAVISGRGTILVMDDEEILRNVVGELLVTLGYEVRFAADGSQTIEAYCRAKEAGRPFDCILMDLTIPGGMGGKEAIQKLRQIDPSVKAIVSSGYSDDPVMADFRTHGFSGVVAKPYDAKKLSHVLHEVMNRNG